MKKIINNRNEYLNSLSIKKNDRHKYIISNTESLNKIEITKLIKEEYIKKKIIEKKQKKLKQINKEILYEYIEYLEILGHKEEYLKQYKNSNNLINIKKYFENNIFISIVDFKKKNIENLFNNIGEFSKHMRKNPELIISPNNAKSEGYKIFLRNYLKSRH